MFKVSKYEFKPIGGSWILTAWFTDPTEPKQRYAYPVGEVTRLGTHSFRADNQHGGFVGEYDTPFQAKKALIARYDALLAQGTMPWTI